MKIIIIISVFAFLTTVICAVYAIKKNRNSKTNVFVFILTTIMTLFGLLLSISNDYLSQFDYSLKRIYHSYQIRQKGLSYDKIIKNHEESSPKFIFLLDVSGSTGVKVKAKTQKDKDRISRQIDKVNRSRHNKEQQKKTFGWDKKNGTILLNELLRIRMLSMLEGLKELDYKYLDYSIVSFSEKAVWYEPDSTKILNSRLDDTYKEFLKKEFDGKITDFYELFNYINDVVFKENEFGIRSMFKSDECIFVFLSDYLHDNKEIAYDKIEDEVSKLCRKMVDANVNLKLYILDYSSISSKGKDLINVVDLLKKNLSPAAFQNFDIIKDTISTWYPLVIKQPIPFFYDNSVFEESLETALIFDGIDNSKTLSIHLANGSDSNKIEYLLIDGESNNYRLSNRNSEITVKKGAKVSMMIKGYIPAPYTSPDVIIEDYDKGARYIIPIAFYKSFPRSGWPLLSCIAGLIIVLVGWLVWRFLTILIGYLKKTETIQITIEQS